MHQLRTITYRLSTVEQAVEIGTSLTGSWFRGHPEVYGELTPSVFRPGLLQEANIPNSVPVRSLETILVEGFRLKAPAVADELPKPNDHLAWLFLMQHHGTPTRLLDWSESILVALYFAVEKCADHDAELWAMAATGLTVKTGLGAIPSLDNVRLIHLAAEPRLEDAAADQYRAQGLIPDFPMPILPPLNFRRMVAQSSTFTLHPGPTATNSIPAILTEEEYLVRYVIPRQHKKRLLDDLAQLGVTHLTLFPDLDGLSTYLRQESNRPQWAPSKPPQCDGEFLASSSE
jgi:hypothetical protein